MAVFSDEDTTEKPEQTRAYLKKLSTQDKVKEAIEFAKANKTGFSGTALGALQKSEKQVKTKTKMRTNL